MPARLRLTLLYAGLFLLLGTAVIVAILLLAHGGSAVSVSSAVPAPAGGGGPAGGALHAQNAAVQQKSADLNRLLAVSWFVLAVTAVAAAGLGWFAAGRVLRPLRTMTATARTISAGNLHQRLALTGPDDEIKQLGDTLDDLLARLQDAFEAQRRFVANASHELRTPLTVERTLLQVALADPDASAVKLRATCEELLASGREHERLLEALLTLASSERRLVERVEPVDLAALAGQALRNSRPEIERRDLCVSIDFEPAPTTGDPRLIARLIVNLIDNAVRHNDGRGQIEIRTASDGEHALLSVSNSGPVIAAGEVERLFEPFQRLGDSRTAGADGHYGLGLSIVRAIAGAHDAVLSAEPRADGGLTVTVRFRAPAARPEAALPHTSSWPA
jgi:signal transduction histidine kinase